MKWPKIISFLRPLNVLTFIVIILLWGINLLPYRIKLSIGKGLGYLLYKISNRRVEIARINLKLCFGDMAQSKREEWVKQSFINLGAGLVEAAISWWSAKAPIYAMTEFKGRRYIDEALAANKGVLLVGGHFSTLDLAAILISKYYRPYVVFRMQTNQMLNYVMMRGRARFLAGNIPHTSLRRVIKKLKDGEIVWYTADQDMGIKHSIFAPFFGQTAATPTAIAKLAQLTNAVVVMLVAYRKPDDSGYVVEFISGPKDFPQEDPSENAKQINQLLETGIMKAPEQYAWYHRRFKNQPGMVQGALYSKKSN